MLDGEINVGKLDGTRVFHRADWMMSMDAAVLYDPFVPAEDAHICALNGVGLEDFTKIYCSCGRIVDIDTQTYCRRLMMHKPVECYHCRNIRISAELDMLDEHYNVIEPEPDL